MEGRGKVSSGVLARRAGAPQQRGGERRVRETKVGEGGRGRPMQSKRDTGRRRVRDRAEEQGHSQGGKQTGRMEAGFMPRREWRQERD